MELGISRTQNLVESRYRRFVTLVGKCNFGIYTIIEEIIKEGRAHTPTLKLNEKAY